MASKVHKPTILNTGEVCLDLGCYYDSWSLSLFFGGKYNKNAAIFIF
jgi:hypothetical protein